MEITRETRLSDLINQYSWLKDAFFAQEFNRGFLLFRHHGCILLVLISTAEDTP